jgi:ribosomal 50S subunit-recycling heat shock protein
LRLDVYLKRIGLIKQRSRSKEICDKGLVTVDGVKAKAGKEISPGRTVYLNLPAESIEIEVVEIPGRNFKRSQGKAFYRVLRHEEKDRY